MTETQKKTLGIAITSLVFGCLFLFPLLGVLFSLAAIILGIIALVKISKNKETLKGEGMAIAGIVLGSIGVVVVPILALLAAIAIPNFIRARMMAQDDLAEAKVKTVAAALESFAAANNGRYPTDMSELTQAQPSYLSDSDIFSQERGYVYDFRLSPDGFKIVASPDTCGMTGTQVFTVDAQGAVKKKDCEPEFSK